MEQIDVDKEKQMKVYRSIIFRLDKEQRMENNWDKRRKINIQLKENLEKALEIAPDDVELKIDLMYTCINLKEIENARKIGKELLGQTERKGFLNGLALIEEKSGNYDKAIEYVKKILKKEPNNQALKERLEILEHKQQNIPISQDVLEKRKAYKKIASLERNLLRTAEEKQEALERKGITSNKERILEEVYIQNYTEVRKIAESIIISHPEEIVAREKLVKSLYILGEPKLAKQEIEDLLNIDDKDEIGLWYLSKIQRNNADIEGEKETLEKILENSEIGTNIKAQKRLELVKHIIEQKQIEEQLEEAKQESYTEEKRKEFIEQLQKDFVSGDLAKKDIAGKIEEARKYPNFEKSLIELTDMEAMMTGDKAQKIDTLETYIDTEPSITAEGYGQVLDEISKTREDIASEQKLEAYLNKKEEQEKKEKQESRIKQREYSKEIIARLNKGEISKEELPDIIKKLETFIDRTRSIFLITKLNEILYNREKAYEELIKYNKILDLSPSEKREIAQMQKALTDRHKETKTVKRIKGMYKKKEQRQQNYQKKVQKEKIKQLLDEGKTVKQIFNHMKESGIAIKTITLVKAKHTKGNEALEREQLKIQEDAQALLKGGYTPDEVYEIVEYDVPISTLRKMNRELRKEETER